MKYEAMHPISRDEAERMAASGDANDICRAIISLALFDDDWRWVQDWSLQLAVDERSQVRGCAATSLGHLARIHGVLDLDRVIPVLERLAEDHEAGGRAEDALGDIRKFAGKPQSGD
ncbi:MAG: hypothetical protein ACLPKI_02410 [Streptosporangiaceae bacterium]